MWGRGGAGHDTAAIHGDDGCGQEGGGGPAAPGAAEGPSRRMRHYRRLRSGQAGRDFGGLLPDLSFGNPTRC